MKTFVAFVVFAVVSSVSAFVPTPQSRSPCAALKAGYVPDGMTPEQWKKMKEKEQNEKANKKFGAFGPQTFKSRSLQSFQKELEKGKADHLVPVFNANDLLKKGKIRKEDIPYMQRGGAWDNSDVKTAKKIQWNEDDKKYEAANKKPFWAGMDWSTQGPRRGPASSSNTKQPEKPKVQKLFGMF